MTAESKTDDLPDWALTYVEAALKCGLKAAQIEEHLVDKGLSAHNARAAVDRYFEAKGALENTDQFLSGRAYWISATLSFFVAGFYMIGAYLSGGMETLARLIACIAAPLAFVWFPYSFGAYVGWRRLQFINRPTPALFIVLAGWFFLIGVPLVILLATWRNA
jgi:hypothetical protein